MTFLQTDIFTILQQLEPKPEPLLFKGQEIYIASLDVVLTANVESIFPLKNEDGKAYYGYSLQYTNGLHDVVWDSSINIKVFTDKTKAQEVANRCTFPKISPVELKFTDGVGYEYIRELDNYKLTSFVAKVGNNQMYEHSFYCYHFLRSYKSTKDRDKTYKELANKLAEESEMHNGIVKQDFELENLYYVSKNLYASREYAKRHSEIAKRMEV